MKLDDNRIQAMLRGRRSVRLVPFPGFGADEAGSAEVGVRILTEEEVDEARAEAAQYIGSLAKRYGVDAREFLSLDAETLDREVQRQIVTRAFLQPAADGDGNRKRFFPAAQGVRQLDTVLQDALFHLYLDHQNHVNPMHGLTEEDVAEIVEALGKEPEPPALLGLYDVRTLRSLVRILAVRLYSLLTGK